MKTNALKLGFCALITSALLIFAIAPVNRGHVFIPAQATEVEKPDASKKKRGW